MDVLINTRLITYNIKVRKVVSNKVRYWDTPNLTVTSMIVSNLLACYRKSTHLVYSRDKYTPIFIGRREVSSHTLIKCVDWLEKEGYITNYIGKAHKSYDKREVSYMDANYKLLREFGLSDEDIQNIENDQLEMSEVMVLRDENKKAMEYRETKILKQVKENVQALNKLLSKHEVVTGDGQNLNNVYCRIYNDTFEYGGRFYRADILRLKQKGGLDQRLDVKIDGESIVEVDFSNLHFRIASAVEGLDTYELPLDVYSGMLEDETNMTDRYVVKLAVNIMFNAVSEEKAARAINQEINAMDDKDRVTLGRGVNIVNQVKSAYRQFDGLFCSGDSYGRRLQNMDSELASDIIQQFIRLDKPILPVHDSFVVKRNDLDLLCEAMGECFRKRFNIDSGVPVGVKWKDDGKVFEDKIVV